MANPEHVSVVKQGKDAWRMWKESYAWSGPVSHRIDLSAAQLSGVDLSGMDFSGVNFAGADLNGSNLRESDLAFAMQVDAFLKEHNVYDFTAADFEQDRETLRQLRVRESQR